MSEQPKIGIFVSDKQGNTVSVGDKLDGVTAALDRVSRALRTDRYVLGVVIVLVLYLLLLALINGNTLVQLVGGLFFSRDAATLIFALLSLPGLYLLAQWSRIIYFLRNPLNWAVSILLTMIFIFAIFLLWLFVRAAFWGDFTFLFACIPAFMIVAVAYCNSFLASLSAEYKQKYEQANQDKIRAERFKSELITNVSHDIQTPLTSIINYTDLLRNLSPEDKQFDTKFEEYTEVLERKSARLKDLTSSLIEASKAATGNVPLDMKPVNLTELIWQVVGEFDDQFITRDLDFVFSRNDEQYGVIADSSQLWRILENLFSNMAKYSLEGTRIFAQLEYVQAGKGAKMVKLSLKNTSTEPLDQIVGELTEQFIRGDKARHSEGSGLGLYIAKSLTELMDGELAVQVSGDQFEVSVLLKA